MDVNDLEIKRVFLKKQKVLEHARTVLKEEFIGIDTIIDEIIYNVSSWYFLPDLQDKPVVVNLWGLTGVGKTSLVNRLAQLIDFDDAYYKFDLGKKEGRFSFGDSLDELCDNNDSSPVIIALDEIQHSRTVSGPVRQEIGNDKNRMMWEMIDSGQIQYVQWKSGLWFFEEVISKLEHLLNAGITVRQGLVITKRKLYCKEMNTVQEEGDKLLFLEEHHYDEIIAFAGKQLGLHLRQDVQKLLLSFSAEETILFLKKVLKIGKRPSIKNFSKALIFVLGNLDEAYTMSDNFTADIDADEFNKLSKKITVPIVKRALQRRFRDEQIARLGNIHIIYPALSRKSYEQIIKNKLEKYAEDLTLKFKLKVNFDHSINAIIYREGVYPTQGVRPIFTSIHQVLKSKISFFYSMIFLKSLDIDSLYFSVNTQELHCEYRKDAQMVYTTNIGITTVLEDVRKNKKDDFQAIVAVHESGHAVLSTVLMNTVPNLVCSKSTDSNNEGFVYSSFAWKYISRKEIIPRVAMMLGGYAAEELIFGKENLTAGASGDIENATRFLSSMYKESGMASTPIAYTSVQTEASNPFFHQFEEIERDVKKTIEEAKLLAEQTLKKEKRFLLSMADYLADNGTLKKTEIKQIAIDTMSEQQDFIENGDHLFYRAHLKQQITNLKALDPVNHHFENMMSLNKKSIERS